MCLVRKTGERGESEGEPCLGAGGRGPYADMTRPARACVSLPETLHMARKKVWCAGLKLPEFGMIGHLVPDIGDVRGAAVRAGIGAIGST